MIRSPRLPSTLTGGVDAPPNPGGDCGGRGGDVAVNWVSEEEEGEAVREDRAVGTDGEWWRLSSELLDKVGEGQYLPALPLEAPAASDDAPAKRSSCSGGVTGRTSV